MLTGRPPDRSAFHPSYPFGMAAFLSEVRLAANVGFLADTARQFATPCGRSPLPVLPKLNRMGWE